jgi:hypothetical protein
MIDVTYGKLDRVLRTLGFSRRTANLQTEAFIYEHQDTGAVIILPVAADGRRALPQHVAAVQATLTEYDIADPLALAGELQNAK